MEKKLNPAEEYELKFLRQRVDELSQKRYELEYHGDVSRVFLWLFFGNYSSQRVVSKRSTD